MDEQIIFGQAETVPLTKLKEYPKNPRRGNVKAIAESLRRNGQFRPIVANKNNGEVLAGNHTLKAAKHLKWKEISVVWVDVDDDHAKRIVLADNRTNDLASYDGDLLLQVIQSLPDPMGTGYVDEDVTNLIDQVSQGVKDVELPKTETWIDDDEYMGEVESLHSEAPPTVGGMTTKVDFDADEAQEIEELEDVSEDLQGLLQLKEDVIYKGDNEWEIPDLDPKMLVTDLPNPLDTWGGKEATPDDGITTWLFNYGVASASGLPWDRSIVAFYTYDVKFENWFSMPGYYTAKVLNAGCKMIVVPDFSFYDFTPRALWLLNVYRAQHLGKYFQEAGLKVIPRIQFGLEKTNHEWAFLGIPKGAPIVSGSVQNLKTEEDINMTVYNLHKAHDLIGFKTYIAYGGPPGQKAARRALDKRCDVVCLDNYVAKRRGKVFDKKERIKGGGIVERKTKDGKKIYNADGEEINTEAPSLGKVPDLGSEE